MNLCDRLTGLLATVAILGILVGLPAILIGVGANPFAGTSWSLHWLTQALTTRDDGTLAIAVFKLTGWIVWAILAATILLELAAHLRNVRAPRLPGLRLPQHAAQALVAAAVLLFITTPTIAHATPPTTNPATAAVPQTTTAQHISGAAGQATPATPALPAAPASTVVKHTVKQGETLWSIAEHYLGDGAQYKQIAAANATLLRGRPGFLLPGWVLTIPLPDTTQTPSPGGTYLVRKGDTLSRIAQTQLGDASRWPEIYQASTAIVQPGGTQLSNPDQIDIGWTLQLPTTPAAAAPPTSPNPAAPEPAAPASTTSSAPPVAATAATEAATSQAPEPTTAQTAPTEQIAVPAVNEPSGDSDWTTRTGYGVSALLAAGLVGLLIRRRRQQQRRRRLGQRLPAPTAAATQIEQELRATADEISVDAIDQTLRRLAHTCTQNGTPLPQVRAARLTATQFDLYLADIPTVPLPVPWTATTDQTVWTLHATDIPTEGPDLDTVPAPYPALVTIGQDDEQGHVLLNLEQLGALGIVGAEQDTREVLGALALELALSAWADDLQVTLVGAFPDLEDVMHTGRIRYLPTLSRILDDLTQRADHDRHTLTTADTDLNTARVTATAPDTWQPEIVLVASPLTDRQRTQLNDLVTATPRVALATVTHGLEIGHWGLDLTTGTSPLGAVLRPIGLHLDPQRLPAAQYSQLLDIVALTDVDELHPNTPTDELSLADIPTHTETPEPPVAEPNDEPADAHDPPPLAENPADPGLAQDVARPQEVAVIRPPRLLMLGPLDLQDAQGSVEPSKRARLLEYATYLALHPGAAFSAIDNAIWPDRKTESNLNTRNTATSKLRRWLGADPDGKDYLPRTEAGAGYRFLPALATDVQDWDQLVGNDPLNTPTENLEKALKLIRGIPFEGAHPKRYGWADPHRQRLISEIVDASYELGKRRLMSGKWRAAEEAVVIGLRIEPAQEMLWRLRILAAHESRNPAAETEAIDRLLAITEQLECDLEPETEQLLADLKHPGTDRDRLLIAL